MLEAPRPRAGAGEHLGIGAAVQPQDRPLGARSKWSRRCRATPRAAGRAWRLPRARRGAAPSAWSSPWRARRARACATGGRCGATVAGEQGHGVDERQALTRSGWRWAKASPTAPQSCMTRPRARPASSRKRSRSACTLDRVAQEPGLPVRPNPGRSTASPPLRSRKGSQSSELWARRAGRASGRPRRPAPARRRRPRRAAPEHREPVDARPLCSITSGTAGRG